MKKLAMIMVMILAVISSGQAQDKLKIGDIRNGKLVVTETNALKAFMMNSLGKSGTLSKDFKVSYAPEGNRLYLYYPVTDNVDHVTNIGVVLVIYKNEVFLEEGTPESTPGGPGAGGSFEISCFGDCPACLPVVKWIDGNWLPIVYCECRMGEGECHMSCKLVIHISVGL
jgi:hypothetical protein